MKNEILDEAHSTPYLAHPRGTKMYRDLKTVFWWKEMKKDKAKYIERCLICQREKAEHQQPSGLL